MRVRGSENSRASPRRPYVEAALVADTQASERQLGFRNVAATERRILYHASGAYLEVRTPPIADHEDENAWLYGQFIVPDESTEAYDAPVYAILHGEQGISGAVRATEDGDFALPMCGPGTYTLDIDPTTGPIIRARFSC